MQRINMNFKKAFGEKIKRLRKKRNLTQEQLAEMIEISPRNLCRIELGNCFVKSETIEKLLTALDVSTEELFANDHIKTKEELMEQINFYIDSAKDDRKTLEKIYKILRDLIEEV